MTSPVPIPLNRFMLPVLHLWRSAEPSQSLISRGLSTMGFALPAASDRATLIDVVIDPSEYDAQILALRG